MQRCHHGHLQATEQMQNVASGRASEDSILVLQAHHVDIVEVQKVSSFLIGLHVVLGERPSHAWGIVVSFFGVVDRKRQQSSRAVLRGNGAAQVGRESGDATVPGKIVPDHRDAAGQGSLRLRPHPSRSNRFPHQGAWTYNFQKSLGYHCVWQRHRVPDFGRKPIPEESTDKWTRENTALGLKVSLFQYSPKADLQTDHY